MVKAFTASGNDLDCLEDWARKIEALGNAVAALGATNDKDQILEYSGEVIGMIIADYAQAINETLEKNRTVLTGALSGGLEPKAA